jgi:hypothetical protein
MAMRPYASARFTRVVEIVGARRRLARTSREGDRTLSTDWGRARVGQRYSLILYLVVGDSLIRPHGQVTDTLDRVCNRQGVRGRDGLVARSCAPPSATPRLEMQRGFACLLMRNSKKPQRNPSVPRLVRRRADGYLCTTRSRYGSTAMRWNGIEAKGQAIKPSSMLFSGPICKNGRMLKPRRAVAAGAKRGPRLSARPRLTRATFAPAAGLDRCRGYLGSSAPCLTPMLLVWAEAFPIRASDHTAK